MERVYGIAGVDDDVLKHVEGLFCFLIGCVCVFFFCRLVTAIGDAYGIALLLHMLTSTVMLTLLAYQATKVNQKLRFAWIPTSQRAC